MFDDIIQSWLETAHRRPDLSKSTKVAYARIARRLIAWPAGAEAADSLPEYVAARREAGVAPRTLALELRVLSVATRWAERHLGAVRAPVLPRIRVDPRVFDFSTVKAPIQALRASASARVRRCQRP